jgi:hypothetical protein
MRSQIAASAEKNEQGLPIEDDTILRVFHQDGSDLPIQPYRIVLTDLILE